MESLLCHRYRKAHTKVARGLAVGLEQVVVVVDMVCLVDLVSVAMVEMAKAVPHRQLSRTFLIVCSGGIPVY